MNSEENPSKVRRGRVKLLMVLACFIGPLAVAFFWYYGLGGVGATSSLVNHSPLIEPVRKLQPFEQPDIQGNTINLDRLEKRWTIIHIMGAVCDSSCETSLYNTRQTRIALGKDMDRVQRLLISPDEQMLSGLSTEHPDAIRALTIDPALGSQLQTIFSNHAKHRDDAVLVDPIGNAMMIIPVELNPSLLLKDLKKLMKLSKIG
ncbi:MAG: SCO family protein [Pseudomonadota bacterium]